MRRSATIHRKIHEGLLGAGALLALLSSTPPIAAAEQQAARFAIEQPSQALSDSLRAIARQTGVSVLFEPAAVNGRRSRAVSGQLSAAEAISRALDGTGLTAEVMNDGSIVVKPSSVPATAPGTTTSMAVQAGSVDGAGNGAEGSAPAGKDGSGGSSLGQKIVITGSRLKQVESEGPVPVNTYTKDDIERSGQPTVERFLRSLNEVSMSTGEGGSGATFGQGTVQLRGLPLGSTLVLVNGRRVEAVGSSSANFFNLNLIPMAAIERIEVVPVGSSAVYGGDALAGVVNIILKKSIDGVSVSTRVGAAKGLSDRHLSLATGGSDAQGSYLVIGSVTKSTPLNMTERDHFKDADYRRFGGTDTRSRACTPGTVTSATSANLPGLSSTFAAIPSLSANQPLTVGSFAATAGQANLCNPRTTGNGLALIHGTESFGLHTAVERRIAGSWSAFGELTYTDDRTRADEIGVTLNNVLVPATNAYNPFGVPVRVTTTLGPENGVQVFTRGTKFTRGVGGVRGELGGGWDVELTGSTTRDTSHRVSNRSTLNSAARDAALASSTPVTSLNPFTAGRAASDDVLGRIWADSQRDGRGRRDQLSTFARGPLVELPAGPIDAIVGAESARDEFATAITGDGALSKSDARRSTAAFAELRVPLFRAGLAEGRSWNAAALTVAGRRDKYSDFGSANTYQAGLELRPQRTLLLRASTATSFKPPTLSQMNVDDRAFALGDFGLTDTSRNNEPIGSGDLLRSTNRGLGPERGKAHAWGVAWEPDNAHGTRLAFTSWRVRINGMIGILDPQDALDNEALFPGFVTRGPSVGGVPGVVTRIKYSEVNFGSVDTAGTDLEASHAFRWAGGRWSLGAGATRINEYRVVLAPQAAAQDRLGRRFADYWAPQWKGRLSAGFERGAWSLGLTSRYLGSYLDAGTSTRSLGGYWTHDLAGGVDLKKVGLPLSGVSRASLSFAINNVGDRLPEFVAAPPYYDVTQADWRGRYASVRLTVDW